MERLFEAIDRQRLLDTAIALMREYSPTGQAKPALDRLAKILQKDGFEVERPTGGYDAAPAVAVRFQAKKSGPTVQFNGHLDTVHLPFMPPSVQGELLRGTGAADMKAGTAAAVEALRALRDTDSLPAGQILLTAHDLHESPWGDSRQLMQLIRDGFVGDAVLLPEYLNHCLPVIGRGGVIFKAHIRRNGGPIHEVLRPREPNVIAVGAELVHGLLDLNLKVSHKSDPLAGPETVFVGQIHSGEIFNQFPQECCIEGTRRWLPSSSREDVENQMNELFAQLARTTETKIESELILMRDAFQLEKGRFVDVFQSVHEKVSGAKLPDGAKPFCDDGNTFWAMKKIPAITHGPRAGGAHTIDEWVDIDDLVRVAKKYALTAARFCSEPLAA